MTRRLRRTVVVTASVLALAVAGSTLAKRGDKMRVLISFGIMYGVDEGFVGETNPIRDVVGDELPWVVAKSAKGKLESNGHLKIKVRGLVFTDDPEVPVDLQGTNDEEQFRGMVSCLTEDTGGGIVTANVVTEGFPANPEGDSDIDAQLTLPNPCVAPIVFVLAGSEDKWFAVTGFEAEETAPES